MFESMILGLDFNSAKALLQSQNIHLSDDEIRYLLPILQRNVRDLKNPQKRQALLQTLPSSLQAKVNDLLQQYQQFL